MAVQLLLNKTRFITGLSWLGFFGILLLYQKTCSYSPYFSTHLVVTFINLLCLFTCAYFIKKHLIPKFLYRKKIAAFIGWLVLLILVISNVMQWLAWGWYDISKSIPAEAMKDIKTPFYQVFTAYLVIIFGCVCVIALRLLTDQWQHQARYAELQKEKAQTELSFLKAQVNPHFLFNSINSIFAHIDKKNTVAREIVLKFSAMLRYQLYECNGEKVTIENEIEYLHNYIELQRLRKEENLVINVETAGNMHGFEIAPLLIVPFIENAFKYVSTDETQENSIQIKLGNDGKYFSFYCVNTTDNIPVQHIGDTGGIGINNVKRRLELLYPSKYVLDITNTENLFSVYLKIDIS